MTEPFVEATVEAEALPAATLRALVREVVEHQLPERALEITRVAEEDEKRILRMWAGESEPDDDDETEE